MSSYLKFLQGDVDGNREDLFFFIPEGAVRFGKLHLYPKEVERNFDRRPDFVNLIGALVRARPHHTNMFFPAASIFCVFFTRKCLFENFSFFPNKKILRKTRRFSQFLPFRSCSVPVLTTRTPHRTRTQPSFVKFNFLFR